MTDLEVVRLTTGQRTYAEWVARKRYGDSRANGDAQRSGCPGGIGPDLTGASAEAAFAVWHNPARPRRLPLNTYHAEADYPPVTEIRSTEHPTGRLIVRPIDRPDFAYVLAVPFGSSGTAWRLAGWTWGEVARQGKWWDEVAGRVPAWFVPQGALLPMALYRRMIPT